MKYPYTKTIHLDLQTRIHLSLVLVILWRVPIHTRGFSDYEGCPNIPGGSQTMNGTQTYQGVLRAMEDAQTYQEVFTDYGGCPNIPGDSQTMEGAQTYQGVLTDYGGCPNIPEASQRYEGYPNISGCAQSY